MDKYDGRTEAELLGDDFKFCRLLEDMGLYRGRNGEVVIAKVTDKGKLEVFLHCFLDEVPKKDEDKNPRFDSHGFYRFYRKGL